MIRIIDKNELKRTQKYTDEELLEFLRKFYKENGRTPMAKEFNNNSSYPSFGTYDRFGGWNNAILRAGLKTNNRIPGGGLFLYTDEELLEFLRKFYKENGSVPKARDFNNNDEYPSFGAYQKRFGTLYNAIKLAGLNKDISIENGILRNTNDKGRLFELKVKSHFEGESVDLAGENHGSSYDGICPTKQTYNVKSSALRTVYSSPEYYYWSFHFKNIVETDWYYFGAFNDDYTELLHVWRIPGNILEGWLRSSKTLYIGISENYVHNLKNIIEYEITNKFVMREMI